MATYTPLANLTLSSSAASVTFSSISQAYRDLVLVVSGSGSASFPDCTVRYNSDTGANYSTVYMNGDGSAASSGTLANQTRLYISGFSMDSASLNTYLVNVMDYSTTDKQKSTITRGNTASIGASATVGRWASTSAITSLAVIVSAGTFNIGSSFALYGIASA